MEMHNCLVLIRIYVLHPWPWLRFHCNRLSRLVIDCEVLLLSVHLFLLPNANIKC